MFVCYPSPVSTAVLDGVRREISSAGINLGNLISEAVVPALNNSISFGWVGSEPATARRREALVEDGGGEPYMFHKQISPAA